MSIDLMSAIFQTEFRDLQDAEGKTTKASTAKIVLLAMADNANDEGEGVYPAIETLSKKCALSEQTIRNTFDALLYNGIIYRVGVSKYMTHNHTINTKSFPASKSKRDFPSIYIEVKPVEGLTDTEKGSNEYSKGVKPVDPNHQLTINKTSTDTLSKQDIEQVNAKVDYMIGTAQQADVLLTACQTFEMALFGSPVNWPWGSNAKWQKFAKWIAEQDPAKFTEYATWRKGDGKFHAMSNNKIRQDPQMFMDTGWPTFLAHSSMYSNNNRDKGFAL